MMTEAELFARAKTLCQRYYTEDAMPSAVQWAPLRDYWADADLDTRVIRLNSSDLRDAPAYVIDDSLLHELAHLASNAEDGSIAFRRALRKGPLHRKAKQWRQRFLARLALGPPESTLEVLRDIEERQARYEHEAYELGRRRAQELCESFGIVQQKPYWTPPVSAGRLPCGAFPRQGKPTGPR